MRCTVGFTILLTFLLFVSCTKDGQDGLAYLKFDWDWYVDAYWDNNPSTPSSISRNQNYSTNIGTYSYEYLCSDGLGSYWGYDGYYTITINSGGKATLFKDGVDGRDRYYSFFLKGSGSHWSYSKSKEKKSPKKALDVLEKLKEITPEFSKEYIGDIYTETFYANNFKIVITQRYFLIK